MIFRARRQPAFRNASSKTTVTQDIFCVPCNPFQFPCNGCSYPYFAAFSCNGEIHTVLPYCKKWPLSCKLLQLGKTMAFYKTTQLYIHHKPSRTPSHETIQVTTSMCKKKIPAFRSQKKNGPFQHASRASPAEHQRARAAIGIGHRLGGFMSF